MLGFGEFAGVISGNVVQKNATRTLFHDALVR